MKYVVLFLAVLFTGVGVANAADLEWSGLYRIEGDSFYNPDLDHGSRGVDYGLQHLILRPKIIASDGFTIRSQFDVFNNNQYPNSGLGQYFGGNARGSVDQNMTTNNSQSNLMSTAGAAGTIGVTQLYGTWDFEYGSLIFGRAPLQFGLGVTYNAGMGLFDHFYDTLDMVGYKFVYGNLWFMPMIGKSGAGQYYQQPSGPPIYQINRDDSVDDYLLQAQYESPEDDLEMGVMYHLKHAGAQASDAPISSSYTTNTYPNPATPSGFPIYGSNVSTHAATANLQYINVYALKDTPRLRLGAEFGYQQGDLGLIDNMGNKYTLSGFGLATELEYRPTDSDWKLGFKAGMATGSDPANTTRSNGYIFNQNYDAAFLLFNHPVGQFDIFHTRAVGGGGGLINTSTEINSPDTDAISNVIYFAPYVVYRMSDRWNMKAVVATGVLNGGNYYDYSANSVEALSSRMIGEELDYSVNFTPRKGISWINEAGVLFPGGAFKGDGDYTAGVTFGIQTKAAISF